MAPIVYDSARVDDASFSDLRELTDDNVGFS